MATINYAYREIICKIVYYGPGVGGKTTNLQIIHSSVPQTNRGDLVSLATEQDRTLFFDFLALELGEIKGFKTRFQLYTVPGQVQYNATRKLVLQGVDGVVFVADSQKERLWENVESFENLIENLKEYDYLLSEVPFVLQLNKRDLLNVSLVEEILEALGNPDVPYFEAVAVRGIGVKETLKKISGLVLDKLNKEAVARVYVGKLEQSARDDTPLYTDNETPETNADAKIDQQRAAYPRTAPKPVSGPRIHDKLKNTSSVHSNSMTTSSADWTRFLPKITIRQKSEIYWNKIKIGSASIELKPNASQVDLHEPVYSVEIDRTILHLFNHKDTLKLHAAESSLKHTVYGDFFVLLSNQEHNVSVKKVANPKRVYVQKAETPYLYVTEEFLGGKFLLVPEGKRGVSPE